MSADFFLDTNVLVYTFDRRSLEKRDAAIELVAEALRSGQGRISSQVVQEFLNVALRKFRPPLAPPEARRYVADVLAPLCNVYSSLRQLERALSIHERWQLGFYDSLIVAGALEAGCEILYSEDLQHDQQIESVVIVDPFRSV